MAKPDGTMRQFFLSSTKGMTFRHAHEVVGKIVLFAVDHGKELNELTLEELKGFSRQINKDVYAWLDPVSCLKRRNIPGGTGPDISSSLVRERATACDRFVPGLHGLIQGRTGGSLGHMDLRC